MPGIPASWLRVEDNKFEAIVGYIANFRLACGT
jgi:hypothetical protein